MAQLLPIFLVISGFLFSFDQDFIDDSLSQQTDSQLTVEPFSQFSDIEVEHISTDVMRDEDKIIYIRDQWKFKPGDNPEWSAPELDDDDWEIVSTNLNQADLAFIDWNGVGWFRKEFSVAEEWVGRPIALLVERHLGASEIYLNGEKIYELGEFSTEPDRVQAYHSNQPLAIVFTESENQILAVRFINPDHTTTDRILGNSGFRFLLGDWETHQEKSIDFLSGWIGSNMFYIGILLAFALIHLVLFVFYPVEKRNLFFSLFVTGLMAVSYLYYRIELGSNSFDVLYFLRYVMISEILVLTFATRFTHSLDRNHNPIFVNAFMGSGFLIAFILWIYPGELFRIRDIAVIIFLMEILRSLFLMFYRKRYGIWILGSGVLTFVIGLVASILINYEVITGSVLLVNMVSSGALILSMSIFLSREVATTQKNLETKLIEVQELSVKTLQQEKINKEREIEKRLLEVENNRKTAELEEARALQISMLPKKMPSTPDLDIAVYMQTATEVGGDYYDYSIDKDGTLVLALGDATGHGMKAGIMVAAAKSYFHTLVHETDSLSMLKRISSGLRNMNMRLMYMGLILVRCCKNEVEITIAGMPPVLHFSKKKNQVNQIVLKGLPLGSKTNYPYENEIIKVEKGDVLLLMSDGIIELFNENREMLGIEKVESIIQQSNGYSANDIINQLKQLADSWSKGALPHDDITLMALKVT